MDLIKILTEVTADVRSSGNLEYKIKQFEWGDAKELADSFFEKYDKVVEVFEKGLELGREIKQKVVYILKYETNKYLVFVGTEADILRKIEEASPESADIKEI